MILARFEETLARHAMVRRGERILLAVSGGADSLCLLHLFLEVRRRLGLKLAVAHFDHGFRGGASKKDASFVAAAARREGLPFSLGGPCRERGGGLQQAAREERLAFLMRAARERRCRRIALGHTLDDQAETMIMRFIAGGGPSGLAGIPPVSHGGFVMHPLIHLSRSEIESYLEGKKVKWRTDPSNARPVYLRNRLRLNLLPLLEKEYNPSLVAHLGALADLLRRDNDLLDRLARDLIARLPSRRGERFLPASLLRETHPALTGRAVLALLRALAPGERGFRSSHVQSLLAPGGASRLRSWDLPGGVTAFRDRSGLVLRKGKPRLPPSGRFSLPVPGRALLPRSLGKITAWVRTRKRGFDPRLLPGLPWSAVLDWEEVHPPLSVRRRRPGDRFRPLGLGGGRKLQDILTDRKVPPLHRDRLPLVCDSRGIIWVPGFNPAHACRVTEATKKLLFLRAGFELPDAL